MLNKILMSEPGVEARGRRLGSTNFNVRVIKERIWGVSHGVKERKKEKRKKDSPTLGSAGQVIKISCYAINSNIVTVAPG